MAVKWKRTRYPGVRFYEHTTRKHGVGRDRYFSIRYQRNGKRREEGIGWASQGWTAEKAAVELAGLKKAQTIGEGACTLAEKREKAQLLKKLQSEKRREKARTQITFSEYFTKSYQPIAKISKKRESYRKEIEHFQKWLAPVLGGLPLKKIHPLNIERVKKNMLNAKRSPRTIQYVFATFRQCWNMAKRDGIVSIESPTKQVKIPTLDNKRTRFLSYDEADKLLEAVKSKSTQTYEIALLSLHCGCRASEVFRLAWGDIDTNKNTILLRNTKNKNKSRMVYMTSAVRNLFLSKTPGGRNSLVFPDRNGRQIRKISNSYAKAVNDVGLNDGVKDRRQRIVFHSLRHSFASWHVAAGTDLYVLKELLGHSTLSITERYSHVQEKSLQLAVQQFEQQVIQFNADETAQHQKMKKK